MNSHGQVDNQNRHCTNDPSPTVHCTHDLLQRLLHDVLQQKQHLVLVTPTCAQQGKGHPKTGQHPAMLKASDSKVWLECLSQMQMLDTTSCLIMLASKTVTAAAIMCYENSTHTLRATHCSSGFCEAFEPHTGGQANTPALSICTHLVSSSTPHA